VVRQISETRIAFIKNLRWQVYQWLLPK